VKAGRKMLKIIIWGVGVWGKRVFSRLRPNEVIAFIDSDSTKIGTEYKGKKIISLDEYRKKYSQYFILISMMRTDSVEKELKANGIYRYWRLVDCPSEFHGAEYRDLDSYIMSLAQGRSYGIYGTGFYSIYFYNRLKEGKCKEIYLILEEESRIRIEEIKETFEDINIIETEIYEKKLDKIFVTEIRTEENLVNIEMRYQCEIEYIFDLSSKIPNYRNDVLTRFKNINRGEKCFIVATGPSLQIKDLDMLKEKQEKTISMNKIYLAFDQTEWRPDYYVVTDWRCISEDENIIKSMSVKNKFISDRYEEFWREGIPKNIYRYHEHSFYVSGKLPPFSETFEFGLYVSGTITYECIQLAAYMGFKEIYLIGVDFSFSANYKDEVNHFVPNYYSPNSQAGVFLDKESLLSYLSAKKYADSHGIKIYNATRGGKLEVFERVDFDKLMGVGGG